jgi:3-methyladenine DNA glycosylase Tag
MITKFKVIHDRAAKRKGGEAALAKLLSKPKKSAALKRIRDDRWLAEMTRRVFQAGFNWKVVDAMWPGFETVFHGFDPNRCRKQSINEVERLLKDTRIVRHAAKIRSVQLNADFVTRLAQEHGSAGGFFAASPPTDFIALLDTMKRRGDRLGFQTSQYVLRGMGVDGFILSKDVLTALIGAGVITSAPTSKTAWRSVQNAFNQWCDESGLPLMAVSRTLSCSVGENRV